MEMEERLNCFKEEKDKNRKKRKEKDEGKESRIKEER